MYQLYCFGESGNAYKVALFLAACELPWEAKWVDFFNGETRSDAFRSSINEMGEAPVLIDGNRKLSQSGMILMHLAKKHEQFNGQSENEEQEILRWILYDNHKFTSSIASLRFMINFTKTGETPVTEWLRNRALTALKIVDQRLASSKSLVSDRLTIADLSLSGYLFYGNELPFDLTAFPNVLRWLDTIKALPGWRPPYEMMPTKA